LSTLGYAAGPVVTGWIHDSTGSYVTAIWLFIGVSILCVVACLACRPLQRVLDERAREAA
jgi:cyanate permease